MTGSKGLGYYLEGTEAPPAPAAAPPPPVPEEAPVRYRAGPAWDRMAPAPAPVDEDDAEFELAAAEERKRAAPRPAKAPKPAAAPKPAPRPSQWAKAPGASCRQEGHGYRQGAPPREAWQEASSLQAQVQLRRVVSTTVASLLHEHPRDKRACLVDHPRWCTHRGGLTTTVNSSEKIRRLPWRGSLSLRRRLNLQHDVVEKLTARRREMPGELTVLDEQVAARDAAQAFDGRHLVALLFF